MITKDILLVDDDVDSLRILSTILDAGGFQVSVTSGGIEALEMLRHTEFRIIVTDFEMPGMNGVELARKVRERHPGAYLILVTGGDLAGVVQAARRAGISAVLSKPLDLKGLVEVISCSLSACSPLAGEHHPPST